MLTEVLLVVMVIVVFVLYCNKDPPGLPPGPPRYPLIGCIEKCSNYEECRKLQKKYGDTFSLRAGSQTFVFMCNYKTIKETFSRYEFVDRPDWKFLNFLTDGEMAGVIFRNGLGWQTLRRFLLRNLRDMGMGKSRLDDVLLREVEELVKDFRNYIEKPTFFPPSINVAVLNIIWQLVASKRYDMNSEEIKTFSSIIKKFQDDIKVLVLPTIFPLLNYLPGPLFRKLFRQDQLQASVNFCRGKMEEVIREHRADLDPASPRDVLDEFLLEMEAQKDDPHTVFNEVDLIKTIFDLFSAGYDTTSNMLRWIILHMANQPAVQQRVQQELDEVVPRDTLPSHVHRPQLPYLEAMVNEVYRTSSLASTGVAHAAVHDTYLDGFYIPKGTAVIAYAEVCHFDPQFWDEPQEFRPERFLNEEGNVCVPKESFLPFGTGKRSCLGESLARWELYMFTAGLLQNFTFAPPEGREVDMGIREMANARFPKDQEIVIRARN